MNNNMTEEQYKEIGLNNGTEYLFNKKTEELDQGMGRRTMNNLKTKEHE